MTTQATKSIVTVRTTPALLEEILAGEGVSLREAAALIPWTRQKPTYETIQRWMSRGVKRPDGSRLRLETARASAGTI